MDDRWRASDVELVDTLWDAPTTTRRVPRLVAGAAFVVLMLFGLGYFLIDPISAPQPAVTEPMATPRTPTAAPRAAPVRGKPVRSPSTGPADPTHPYEAPLADFAVKIDRVATARAVRDPQWGTHRPAGKYVVIHLSLRNTTRRPVYPPVHLPLVTADGRTFLPVWEPTFGQTVLVAHGDLGRLNPGATTRVVIVYDVPEHAVAVTLSGRKLHGA